MADSNYIYTVGGYAAIIGIGLAVYHVSQTKNKRAAPAQTRVTRAVQQETRKEDKKKKQRMESFASEIQEAKQAAAAAAQNLVPVETSAKSSAPVRERDADADNREFARQLAKAKEGTKFSSKSDGGKQREKSVKQSRANQMAGSAQPKTSNHAPAAAADAAADADDDQSPAASPEAAPVDASGVADMLEPTPSGPSVLRLTDTTEKKKQTKAKKAAEPVETKKQRQNRLKNEAAKAAREEAEKERKALEEKQRRQARVAEGRAAKDGSQFMAAVNGNNSAWKQGSSNGTTPQSEVLHQPLDTWEQVPSKKQDKAKAAKANKPAENTWASSLPSEEEQLEMIKDEADEWSTVKTKSAKKSAKQSSSVESGDEPVVSRPAAAIQQPVTNVASSKTAAPKPQNFGSFSALTTKDEPVEEEEEEWDV
jgi:hypothetical protein